MSAARRIALTGASGFIGRHLATRLLGAGHEVRVLIRRAVPDLVAAGALPVEGGLEDAGALARLVDGADTLIHAAGLTQAGTAAEFHRVNAEATARLAALAAAARTPSFVLISSLAAREPGLSDYAASKRGAEEAVAAHGDLDWTILRPPAVYGPGDTATLELFRLMSRGVLPVPPTAEARVSLIYVDDLCRAIEALVVHRVGRRSVLEVRDGCEAGYGWRDLIRAGERALSRRVFRLPIPYPLLLLTGHIGVVKYQLSGRIPRISPGKVRELCHIDWVCRANPIEAMTDWTPLVGIDDGFERTVGWYRERRWL